MSVTYSKKELREKLLSGSSKLNEAVSVTLGPLGRNVIIKKGQTPFVTKDGVTVAENLELPDSVENLACSIIKQAAKATVKAAGDGTTTSTVLAHAIFKKGSESEKHIESIHKFKKGMDAAVVDLVNIIGSRSSQLKTFAQIESVATISANNDKELGSLIASAFAEAGTYGTVVVRPANEYKTSIVLKEGYQFNSGMVSSEFATNVAEGIARISEPKVLIFDHRVGSDIRKAENILSTIARSGKYHIIVADDFEDQFIGIVLANCKRGSIKCCLVKAPFIGSEKQEFYIDLATVLGGKPIKKTDDFLNVYADAVGMAEIGEIKRDTTILISGAGKPKDIEERMLMLRNAAESENVTMDDAKRLLERIQRINSKSVIIKVGGVTEVEMIERTHRVEDALEAIYSATQEGIIPGGGAFLMLAASSLSSKELPTLDEQIGYNCVLEAVRAPFLKMMETSCINIDVNDFLREAKNEDDSVCWTYGIDFSTGHATKDMLQLGIVDPAKVTRCALVNAASVASTLLTTDYSIIV